MITIERNELLALLAYHKEKDFERETDREGCTDTTSSVRVHSASHVDSAFNNSKGHTFESFRTEHKGNKSTKKKESKNRNYVNTTNTNNKKDSMSFIEWDKGRDKGKEDEEEKEVRGMTRTLDREFLNNLFSTSDKSKHHVLI